MYALLKRKLAHESLIKLTDEQFDKLCTDPSDRLREAAGKKRRGERKEKREENRWKNTNKDC